MGNIEIALIILGVLIILRAMIRTLKREAETQDSETNILLEYPDSPEAERVCERRAREKNLTDHHPPSGA